MGLLNILRSRLAGGPQRGAARHTGGAWSGPGTSAPSWPDGAASASDGGFVVLDVETTGLSPRSHRILEIALVRTDATGRVVDEWHTRINPEGPVGATHIHGITAADVRHAPRFADVLGEVTRRVRGRAVAAHNAKFDLAFLRAGYARAGWRMPFLPALCTLEASWHYLPRLDRRRLPDCCWASGIRLDNAHSALGDARATAILLRTYLDPHFGPAPLCEHVEMPTAAAVVVWPEAPQTPRAPSTPRTNGRVEVAAASSPRRSSPVTGTLLEQFATSDALDEGAPREALPYLELLAEALEDGDLSEDERAALADVATAYDLEGPVLGSVHRAFVAALARHAVEDGRVSRSERAEIVAAAELLSLNKSVVTEVLDAASEARYARFSLMCKPLPEGWALGEPLRVGDRVVFTGCDEGERARLERGAEAQAVRVMSSISRSTAMLVTDDSFYGTKAEAAASLGLRVVTPDEFADLLKHVQPALPRGVTSARGSTSAPGLASGDFPRPPDRSGAARANVDLRSTGSASNDTNPALIRAWAHANGYEVGARGRLPAKVIAAFTKAQNGGGN